jgi:hypothetical protein
MFFDNDETFQIPKSKFQGAVNARPSASSLNIAYGIKIDMAIGRSPYSTLPNTVNAVQAHHHLKQSPINARLSK